MYCIIAEILDFSVGSKPLRPDAEWSISAIQAYQEKVVFVRLYIYYPSCSRNDYTSKVHLQQFSLVVAECSKKNRKHFLRVFTELYYRNTRESLRNLAEKAACGNTRLSVSEPTAILVLPKFHYNSRNTKHVSMQFLGQRSSKWKVKVGAFHNLESSSFHWTAHLK